MCGSSTTTKRSATALDRALRLERFDVRCAPDGESALAAVGESPPDVMVLDVAMPGIDGVAVTREMRGDGNELPICILSAAGAGRFREHGYDDLAELLDVRADLKEDALELAGDALVNRPRRHISSHVA